jgi:hypothetical protein
MKIEGGQTRTDGGQLKMENISIYTLPRESNNLVVYSCFEASKAEIRLVKDGCPRSRFQVFGRLWDTKSFSKRDCLSETKKSMRWELLSHLSPFQGSK